MCLCIIENLLCNEFSSFKDIASRLQKIHNSSKALTDLECKVRFLDAQVSW